MRRKGVIITVLLLLLSAVSATTHLSRKVPSSSFATPACTTTRRLPLQVEQQQQHQQHQQLRGGHGLSRAIGFVVTSTLSSSKKFVQRQRILSLLELRGGAAASAVDDDDEDSDDDGEYFDDSALLDLQDGAGDKVTAESEFDEDNTLDRMWDAWKKTPPLTKVFLQASILTTLYGYLFNKNEFPKVFTLDWKKAITRLQIWRLLTSFLNFGPLGLGYLMTAHFVWTYMSTLERLSYSKPYDFWIMILFGQLSMVIGYPLLKLSPRFLGHNLSTYLVYIWSRYHEGMEVNLFELFNTRAEMLPWFFLAQTFLLEGEPPVLDFLGIAFGHVYHHCKTVGLLRAPQALVDWYRTGDSTMATRIRQEYRKISSDFEML